MLVRIVKDWTSPDIFRQTPHHSKCWDGIYYTEDNVLECDLLLVLNAPHKPLFIKAPINGRWLFSQESPIDYYRYHLKSFKYFSKVFTYWDQSVAPNIINAQTALPWHIGKSYDELMTLSKDEAIAAKSKNVSWVTSNATDKEGHVLRMCFKDYLKANDFEFDLFGRGFCPIDDKFDAIYPYKYSIAIENYACNDYWTEKIADCFLSWTMPIYYGAKNITKYFPKEAIIVIDPNEPEKARQIINESIKNNIFLENILYIQEARELILNRYQLFPYVTQMIKKSSFSKDKKWKYIPKNGDPRRSLINRVIRKIKLK